MLVCSCAHSQAAPAKLEQLGRTIEALRVQNSAYVRQVEELENRVFILTDQLESRKINEEKVATPQLPTVTLHPESPASPQVDRSVPASEGATDPQIEYAGDAAKTTGSRPVLRLHGDAAQVSITRDAPSAQPRSVRVVREGMIHSVKVDDSPEAMTLYRKSYEALRAGKHEQAIEGFHDFLQEYPSHDLADNSQYWLGECYYDRKDFASAVREFRRVVELYPSGNKVPDALLKIGFSYFALGSAEAGRQTLEQLRRSYPRHESSALAGARLGELDHARAKHGSSAPHPLSPSAPQSMHAPKEAP